jgi:hypothetical protein
LGLMYIGSSLIVRSLLGNECQLPVKAEFLALVAQATNPNICLRLAEALRRLKI